MTDLRDLVTWEPNHRPSLRRGCLLIVAWIVLGLALGFAAGRASASGPQLQYAAPGPESALRGSQGQIRAIPPTLPPTIGGASAAPTLESDGGAAIGGLATWYCGGGSPCTRGYGPSDLIAAVDPSLGIRRGSWLTVHSGGRSVTVTVVDVCACKGARIVDLSRLAFSRLANPSVGTIPVSVTVGGPLATLPPTDTDVAP